MIYTLFKKDSFIKKQEVYRRMLRVLSSWRCWRLRICKLYACSNATAYTRNLELNDQWN